VFFPMLSLRKSRFSLYSPSLSTENGYTSRSWTSLRVSKFWDDVREIDDLRRWCTGFMIFPSFFLSPPAPFLLDRPDGVVHSQGLPPSSWIQKVLLWIEFSLGRPSQRFRLGLFSDEPCPLAERVF